MSPAALMAKAGHSDFKTTQGYIDLAGETFREEEELLEARLFGQKLGRGVAAPSPQPTTESPATPGLFAANGRHCAAGVGFEPTARD